MEINMIDNIETIENFMQCEQGSFYKFLLMVRNTDGENVLYTDGMSNSKKNLLIKEWYVDSLDRYYKIKHEMITLANLTGARLYMVLDRKSNLKLIQELAHAYIDMLSDLVQGKIIGIKGLSKVFASLTQKVETSDKAYKTLMFDVDTKDEATLNKVKDYVASKGQPCYILNTKKGYHVVCFRKFDHKDWKEKIDKEDVSVKDNDMGLVYYG